MLACLFLAASHGAEKKLKVLTTFLPAYSFAASVAGDRAEVENLLPGGVSLHDFQLTPTELRKIAAADLIAINGLGMETFIERLLANAAAGTKDKIVVLSAGLEAQLIEEEANHRHDEPGHDHGHDPHIWLDPLLAKHCVTNLLAAFQKADAAHAAAYAKNAADYLQRLDRLNRDMTATLAPVKDTPFITYHNAFRYFARRYGLRIVGVVEVVPEVSPSPRDLANLHKTIRAKKARALFTEPNGQNRLASQIAADAKIALGELDPLETGELKPGSYEEGMRRNAENLARTLK